MVSNISKKVIVLGIIFIILNLFLLPFEYKNHFNKIDKNYINSCEIKNIDLSIKYIKREKEIEENGNGYSEEEREMMEWVVEQETEGASIEHKSKIKSYKYIYSRMNIYLFFNFFKTNLFW